MGDTSHQIKNADSAWWSWNAPAAGAIHAIVANHYFLPRLAFYSGTTLAELTSVAVATNQLHASVTAGTPYQMAVETADGGVGPFTLEFHFAPAIVAASQPQREAVAATPLPIRLQLKRDLHIAWNGTGSSHLTLHGTPGRRFVLQASDDLVKWHDVIQGVFLAVQFECLEPDAPFLTQRFYRAVLLP